MIDTHYHLDQLQEPDLKQIMQDEVDWIVAPAMGYESLMRLIEIQQQFPKRVKIAAGFHPERELGREAIGEKNRILSWIAQHAENICAIGEIGLPFYSLSHKSVDAISGGAWEIFEDFLAIAKQKQLPVILHAVHEMAEPCYLACKRHGIEQAVFHWLKAPEAVVKQIVDAGYHISTTPEVTERERDQQLIRLVPLTQLLLETDGPYPLRGQFEGQLPRPSWIRKTIKTIANLHHIEEEQVESVTTQNAMRFFNIT